MTTDAARRTLSCTRSPRVPRVFRRGRERLHSAATPAPIFFPDGDPEDPLFTGGNFWDGRATGEKLGNPAADQAAEAVAIYDLQRPEAIAEPAQPSG